MRKAKYITQGELAEAVGTSFQTISKWENGITMPDITVLPVLASYFDVSVDELLGLKPLNGEIIKCDFLESNFHGKFDVVICQSVLRHIGDSREFIEKMIRAAKENGLIICIDANREIECCGIVKIGGCIRLTIYRFSLKALRGVYEKNLSYTPRFF